jgi:hypothetical protein
MARDVAGILSGKIVPLRSPDAAQCAALAAWCAADPGSIDWSGVALRSSVTRCTASGTLACGDVYPTIRSWPVQNPAFSTFLSTLPTPVIGNSVTNLMCFGACAEPFLL